MFGFPFNINRRKTTLKSNKLYFYSKKLDFTFLGILYP